MNYSQRSTLNSESELAALERRREKTLALKQGMMQELLTGRVRFAKENEHGYTG